MPVPAVTQAAVASAAASSAAASGSTATTTAASTAASIRNAKLVSASRDFEAMMMKELLKPMTSSFDGSDGTDPESSDGSASALGQFASEALGRALSAQGGFGIANQIIGALAKTGASR